MAWPGITEKLDRYLAANDRKRSDRVAEVLAALTPTERGLVKDAAVMGYVQGWLASRDDEVPPDSVILHAVVAACLDMPDLYPALTTPREDTDHAH